MAKFSKISLKKRLLLSLKSFDFWGTNTNYVRAKLLINIMVIKIQLLGKIEPFGGVINLMPS